MNHYRKPTFQKENEDRIAQLKKQIEQKTNQLIWQKQIEEKRLAKQREAELERQKDAEIDRYLKRSASNIKQSDRQNEQNELIVLKKLSPNSGVNQPQNNAVLTDKKRVFSVGKSEADDSRASVTENRPATAQNSEKNQYLNKKLRFLDNVSELANSCLNNSLSRNYVQKYQNLSDYSKIIDDKEGNILSRKPSQEKQLAVIIEAAPLTETLESVTLLQNELLVVRRTLMSLSAEKSVLESQLLNLQNDFETVKTEERNAFFQLKNALSNTSDPCDLLKCYLSQLQSQNVAKY